MSTVRAVEHARGLYRHLRAALCGLTARARSTQPTTTLATRPRLGLFTTFHPKAPARRLAWVQQRDMWLWGVRLEALRSE